MIKVDDELVLLTRPEREQVGSKIMQACEINGVTPYNLIWTDYEKHTGLEVVFLAPPPVDLKLLILYAAAVDIEITFCLKEDVLQ